MWGYILVGSAVPVLLFAAWTLLRLRRRKMVAFDAIMAVKLADIERLRMECEAVFLARLGERLDPHDFEASARALSNRLDQPEALRRAFGRKGFSWYFVLPVGAFIGELLRLHVGAQWQEAGDGGPEVRIPVGDSFATTFPFDKVLKHVATGDRGDIYAYLKSAVELDKLVAQTPHVAEIGS